MKKTEIKKKISVAEALQDPSLARIHKAIQLVHNKPLSQLMPKKHEITLISAVKIETKVLFKKCPNMPIKVVITNIFMRLTDDIPAPLILKLTEIIIEEWEKLSIAVLQEDAIAVAA